uniref:Uncharacterized protein n=1 Tax=viral metagenome TaxID=1070528 RepID=A0A6M3JXN2_9ZZZZ
MPRRTLQLQFPRLGLVRRFGLHTEGRQTEYGSPWAWNVRLEDSLTNRLRGGSFAGIAAGIRPSSVVYRDRTLTFSGAAVTASRVGDSDDTTLSADVSDMSRPALFQFAEAGDTGEDVVALVPHKDQYLLGFAATETWVQQGDPLSGPRRRVSDQVGIIGADAWCVAHDTVYFLSSRGLYSVGADGSGLKPVSEDKLPEDLIGVSDTTATLTYQHSDRGVYIHTTGDDWFYDIARDQFWPFDTEETDSHLLIGPLKLGGADGLGLIQTLHGITASDSATVNWRIVPGETAEEAAANGKLAIVAALAGNSYASYVRGSGSWSAGRSSTVRPRVAAMWACLWLSSASDWAYEGVTMSVIPAGEWRK